MKKITKTLILLISIIFATTMFIACNNNEEEYEYTSEPEIFEDIDHEIEYEETIIIIEEELEVEEELETPIITSSELSDDIFSFQIQLNGHVFTLPFDWAYAENLGWELGARFDGIELGPNQRTFSNEVWQGNTKANFSIGNNTPNNILPSEGVVGEIRITDRDLSSGIEVVMPGGLTIGSPAEQIVQLHGEPSNFTEMDTFRRYTYQLGIQVEIAFTVNQETNLINEIKIMNFQERQESTFDGELSALAQGYVPPSALGDDFSQGIVELEGVVYQLPIPVAVMLNNGWVLEDESTMIPAGRVDVRGRLRYGNQVMRVHIKNYDSVEVPATEGFIIQVEFSHHFWIGNIAIPGGITQDSTKEQVMSLFGEPTRYEYSQSFEHYTWHVTRYDTMRERIIVTFLIEDGSIHSIVVENDPRELSW